MNELGEVVHTNQWSFICGNQTVFDQATLTCNHISEALPCDESLNFYGNVDFFKVQHQDEGEDAV